MKNKIHNQIRILNYITSTDKFKGLFFLEFIVAFYASLVLSASTNNYIDSILVAFQFNIFNIILFSLFFLNTLNTCSVFKHDFSFYIIRLKDRKNYIKEVIKNIILVNIFYMLLFLLIYFSSLLIVKSDFTFYNYATYEINNFIYILYYLFRYFVILLSTSVFVGLIYLNFETIITFITGLLILSEFMIGVTRIYPKDYYDLFLWNLLSAEYFSNIKKDFISSVLVIIILQILNIIVYKLSRVNKKMEIL